MTDAAWTALGFVAIGANFIALAGRVLLHRPGQADLGPLPFILLAALSGIWAWEDERPAVRGALAACILLSLGLALWAHRRRGRVVQSPSPATGREVPVAPKILIYTMTTCPYCIRAKELLSSKGVPFEEVDLDREGSRWDECERRSGRDTVPQIFVGDRHLGGCDDLLALEASGELDAILRG